MQYARKTYIKQSPNALEGNRSLVSDLLRRIQRRQTHHVLRLHIGAALQKNFDDVGVVHLRSFNERCFQ